MDESILRALMRLFAIIATVNKDGVSASSQKIVEAYLKQHLSSKLVEQYLQLFDDFINLHHKDIHGESTRGKKRNSLNSVKVLVICEQINETLQQKEKIIVFLRLLEFVNEEGHVTEKEIEFIDTVADVFNIEQQERELMKTFVIGKVADLVDKAEVLIVNGDPELKEPFFNKETDDIAKSFKHIYRNGFIGRINILHISSINSLVLRYLGSGHLTLSAHPIIPFRTYIIDHGGVIKGGRIKPIYHTDIAGQFFQSTKKIPIVLNAEKVVFKFKGSEDGLHEFNFSEKSGQLIGIMGGSGVGKSTLLNVLNGSIKPQSGRITINGLDLHEDKDQLEGILGFVPQDDLLIEELTVFQNLYFNAKLCFSELNEKQVIKKVSKVLSDLELTEIKNLKVGSPLNKYISGGQRKRLNIALELIREPTILYVDEPTSGLSSMDSDAVMLLLRKQTLKGNLVIVNIHQPSSDIYKLFDKLLIMDKGGRNIYSGNPIDAIEYFRTAAHHVNAEEGECITCGNVNPEQVLQIVEERIVNQYGKFTRSRRFAPQEWFNLYKEKIEKNFEAENYTNKLPKSSFKIPTRFGQLKIFTIRNILSKLTNLQYLLITFLEAPLLAIIISYFTKYISGTTSDPNAYIFSENENLPAYIFMSVIVAIFLGLSLSAEEIIKDRKIHKREKFLNLSHFSYINSKILVLFIISAIQTLSFVLIGNYILHVEGMNFAYWLMLFSATASANLIGLNISAALNSVVTIYILIPFILVPQILFSGVIVSYDKLHKNMASHYYVPVIGDLMISRWAYEALSVEQFKNNEYQKYFFNSERRMSQYSYISTFLVPKLSDELDDFQEAKHIKSEVKAQQILMRLKTELTILFEQQSNLDKLYDLNNLKYKSFDKKKMKELRIFLDVLKKFFNSKYKNETQERDKIYNELVQKLGSTEKVLELKQNYYNKNLSNMLQNKSELKKIYTTEDRLVQKNDPIFKYPSNRFGRAHFYSPVKRIGSSYVDTYWFNILFVWLSSLVWYLILYFDLLKRMLDSISRFSERKTLKKQNKIS